jgi:hypothetical protein
LEVSINCKVYMLKVWHKSKMFLHVQINTQTLRMDSPYFFQMSFFLSNGCNHNKRSHLRQGLSHFQGLNCTCGLFVLVYNAFKKIIFQVG